MTDRIYKWFIGVGTVIFGNLPNWSPAINNACNGACGTCGASCLAAPLAFGWLLAVFLLGKIKKYALSVAQRCGHE